MSRSNFVVRAGRDWQRLAVIPQLLLIALFFAAISFGQQITATLTGTTYDQTGAVIPKAQVTVKNQASGDTRQTVSNGDGYFTVTALQPGTYDVTVSAPGFRSWEQSGVVLNQGDSRTLPNISLQVGNSTQQVQVVSAAESVAPVDTGEVSTTLNTHMIEDISIQGRDAGELLKIMPGVVATNGLTQGSGFSDRVVGTNSGPVGSYTADGAQPYGSMSYMLDGANLVDPGNQGTQIANINQDMTAEVKVLANSYDAQYAKGPVIFEAFSKSGGAQFHGEGYLYARNGVLNSVDAYTKSQGQTAGPEHYYYPGGNIGGPVLLPFTHFNRNRDKLFFWAGYEYMNQQPQATPYEFFVPTAQMRAGNFSPAYLASLGPQVAGTYPVATTVPCGTITTGTNGAPAGANPGCSNSTPYTTTNGTAFPGGMIPVSAMDPNALALLKLYPQPNVDPATHGGNNYLYNANFPQNRWEATGKVDYNISQNTKLSVSYSRQNEQDTPDNGFALWWAPASSLPYPGGLTANTSSNTVMSNLTHVFGPTLTNETVFTYARFENPILPANPSASNRSTVGFTAGEVNGQSNPEIPNIESQCCNAAALAGFEPQGAFNQANAYGGAFIGLKEVPAVYDNLSKVAGTHTMKFGFYWDSNGNIQSSSAANNGNLIFTPGTPTSTGNTIADFLLGHVDQYTQGSAIATDNDKYHQYSFYAQDSWKATKKLTLNYGIRFDHIGQWYDTGAGFQVWDPYTYSNSLTPPANTGIVWNAIDKSIPLSGYKSPWAYLDPRFGVAYDIFGTGKTVLRGGFAVFRYQLAFNSIQSPAEGPLGLYTISSAHGFNSIADAIAGAVPSASGANQDGQSPSVLQMGDGRIPWTRDWNVTISQALPGRSLLEVSYVGNQSGDELIEPSSGNYLGDPNTPPLGAYFGPDPNPASPNYGKVISPTSSSFQANDYFPLHNYQQIYEISHGSYANFNAFQMQWQKQAGFATFLVNYTFSKVLGIRDGETANGGNGNGSEVWPYSLGANYGVLSYDHTNVFNAAYIFNLPSPIHGNHILSGAVNGWQLSGVTQLSSGAPIQPNTGGTLNVQWPNNFSNSTVLGTNAVTLEPVLTCNPGANLKSGQYFNPGCFAPPAPGQEGSIVWPYIHGPAFFNSDLSLFKNFQIGSNEVRKLQFRISAFNFLNHPLPQFGKQNNNDEELSFSSNGAYSATNTNTLTNGYPAFTTGNREVELAVKFYF